MKAKREQSLIAVFVFTAAVVITASTAMRYVAERMNHENTPTHRSYSVLGLLHEASERLTLTTIAEASTQGKAVATPAFSAAKLIQNKKSFTVPPLEKFTFEVGYKNTGTQRWEPSTDARRTITLRARARTESYFYDPSWDSGTSVMNISRSVLPGELVYFRFTLESPKKEGKYTEHLSLYYGGKQIAGSEFDLPITVQKIVSADSDYSVSATSRIVNAVQNPAKAVSLTSARQNRSIERFLEAFKLIASDTELTLSTGELKLFEVGYKNTGKRDWNTGDLPHLTLRAFTDKEYSAYHDQATWHEPRVAAYLQSDAKPGQVSYFRFFVKAPLVPGIYKETFYLSFGEDPVVGSDFTLPMEVIRSEPLKSHDPSPLPNPKLSSPNPAESTNEPPVPAHSEQTIVPASDSTQDQTVLAFAQHQTIPSKQGIVQDIQEKEPLIRIGYFKTTDPVQVTASSPYQIRTGNALLSTPAAGAVASVTYEPTVGLYTIIIDGLSHTSAEPPRFTGILPPEVRVDPETIFEIISYQNRPAWSSAINDNTVRGAIEVRYSTDAKALWVVNELPLEYYLRGLAETSNNSPYEFQKALLIAARTYAKYHIDYGSKYPREGFTIRSTDHDQVYRGYGAEKRMPNLRKAVEETRGVIVTYQGQLAITPYYSQSDGRTRSWEEVWAGSPKPWLVGKDDPPGRGLPLLGHGVGMAARGAIALALNGKSFDEILTYYYTDIELTKRYQ
ncbi:SpoIID/LytB domain-containing protein [Candidatus Uhrbacteria bacterium]|nr:SpoIID/LytB domain-containing protein [Candidatus Uhrbacteria bacterium]